MLKSQFLRLRGGHLAFSHFSQFAQGWELYTRLDITIPMLVMNNQHRKNYNHQKQVWWKNPIWQLDNGVIIPVSVLMGWLYMYLFWKKSTLNSNVAANYRPITISSTFSKLLELQLIPQSDIAHTQFGNRKKMGTGFGCSLLSDVFSYFKCKDSPLYMCSLDAEKCFDIVCHKSLFYKLCEMKWWCFRPLLCTLFRQNWAKQTPGIMRQN